ncbi:MAG: PAS domain-containing sensor histidine kinase [Bacteroidota bacterium]|uniref:histidine kinase n=1 Tax=Algoriphagus faecimaris TaxID=686796 RepID=A0A1G6NU06_9BACT|nr:PAS domain-containing sensor histidine kinase [Algoriphagus faecimaris]SDC71422.1 PAS domain S-box-containing protein [Algoriphagus faecimaris]
MNPKSSFSYERFFDLTPDLVCVAGYDGYFKKINPSVCQLLEYSEEELYSRPINEFIHPEDRPITQVKRKNLQAAKPLINFENRYLTKSGKTVWLSWTSWPIPDQEVVFAIAKEVTQKKKLETKREDLLKSLSEKNEELRQLTYITAHDLRAPVSSILSVFELLDLDKIEDQETADLIQLIKRSTLGLKENLNKYLHLIAEKDNSSTKEELLNFSEVFHQVLVAIQPLIQSSEAILEADFTQSPEIHYNRLYLESIFLNLISNSIKYRQEGITPQVKIKTDRLKGRTVLSVKDNGQGMDLAQVEGKLFGKNQTFHQHPDSKGIGLYLISKHISSAGGKIQVESEIGKGSTFTITF